MIRNIQKKEQEGLLDENKAGIKIVGPFKTKVMSTFLRSSEHE